MSISSGAFANNVSITYVELPDTLTSIGTGIFKGCSALSEVKVPLAVGGGSSLPYAVTNNGATTLGYLFGENSYDGAIEVTQGQNTYYIPDSLRKVTVTSDVIVDHAFANCVMIEEIQLPSTVGSIGVYAFSGCVSLKKLGSTVDGELVIPQNALIIGEYAFENLLLIEKVVVPDTVTSIGLGAFKGCEGLIDITIPFIGASIDTSNPYNAVFGYIFGYTVYNSTTGAADNSSTLYVNTAYGSAEGTVWQYTCQNYYYDWYGPGGGYAYRSYYYYIPTSIRKVSITMQTSIPVAAFSNCDFIEEINIPDNATEIGEYAFQNCRSLNRIYQVLRFLPQVKSSSPFCSLRGSPENQENEALAKSRPFFRQAFSARQDKFSPSRQDRALFW
jgi:hypothetical protein